MNKFKLLNALFLFCFLVFSACKKDIIIDEPIIIDPDPTILVDGSVNGLILDLEGTPVPAATVRVGSNSTTSDENGVFSFNNIPLNEKGALVTAEKDGYFYNAKFVFPTLNKRSFTKFKMIQKELSNSFPASSGGTSETNGGAKVTIPANSIKDENGAIYSGNVNVYATWLDPTGVNLPFEMPGDLRGQNADNEQVQLVSYGMIGVKLEDANGAPLNIADGKTATIELPLPAALLGSAPASIPLWHFNEVNGMWEEEGTATLQNGVYVGTVGHFSFWNADVPRDLVTLSGSVINQGRVVPDISVQIIENGSGTSGVAITNEDGEFSGFVPANAVLTLNILNACNEVVFTVQIGPFAEDTTIDPIDIPNEALNSLFLIGTLQDCDFNGVSNGYVVVEYDGFISILPTNDLGEFTNPISICASTTEITVKGYDLTNAKESTPQMFDVTNSDELDIGILNACEDIEDFYIATIGNLSWEYDSTGILTAYDPTPGQGYEIFGAYNNTSTIGLFTTLIRIDTSTVVLNTPLTPQDVTASTDDFTGFCSNAGDPIPCETNIEITFQSFQFNVSGGVVQGSYSGIVEDPFSGEQREISGSFRKSY